MRGCQERFCILKEGNLIKTEGNENWVFWLNINNIPFTWSTSQKHYPPYSDYMKYLGGKKNYPLYSDYMKYWGKNKIIHYIPITWSIGEKIKLSTIFQLHEVLGKKKIHYIPITWSTGVKIKLSIIFRLHEVPRKNKIIHYIPITWSTRKKLKLSTMFRLHEVLGKK